MEEWGKNPLLYVSGGFRIAHHIQTVLPQETPSWIGRWMPRFLKRGSGGWGRG